MLTLHRKLRFAALATLAMLTGAMFTLAAFEPARAFAKIDYWYTGP
jgi:hypothetical protein